MDTTNAVAKPDDDVKLINMWLYGKSSYTVRNYSQAINGLLTHVDKPIRSIGLFDAQEYLNTLDCSAATLALATNAIKSLFTFATELGYTTVNIGKGLKPPKVRSELANRILSEDDVCRMIDLESNPRNHALLRLLYHSGLRVSEIVALKWENIHESKPGAVLDVWGKGEKQRYVPISQEMYAELLRLSGQVSRDRYVFQSRKGKAGTVPMETRQIERIIWEAAKYAGISGNVSPHWLRHSNASHALDNGAPMHVVQQSLGHESLVTTTKYTHIKPGAGTGQYLKR